MRAVSKVWKCDSNDLQDINIAQVMFLTKTFAGHSSGDATRLRRSALSSKSPVSALSPKLRLWPRNNEWLLSADPKRRFYQGPIRLYISWSHSGSPGWSWKTLHFQACFPGRKSQKNDPQDLQKTLKSTLESPKVDLCENMFFAILSLRKPCVKGASCQEFHPKSVAKNDLVTSPEKHRI